MRQIGVCTPGGAEALAIFHQLQDDEWMTGSLNGPLARIGVDEKKCFGMIEWQCARRRRGFSQATRHQQRGNIETSPLLNRKGWRQCPKIVETSTAPWSAAWLWEGWVLKHGNACLLVRRRATFHGLVLRVPQMFSACKQNTQSNCKKLPTSSWVARKSSPEPTTRGTCYGRR